MIRRITITVFVLAMLVGGCSSEDDPGDDGDVGVQEDADEDVDAVQDTGEDADIGEDADVQDADVDEDDDLTIEVRYTGAAGENWRVGAFLVHFEEFEEPESGESDEFPVIEGESASTVVDDELVSLTIPQPQEEDYGMLFDGLEGAGWVLAIYDDVDETGQRDEDDPVKAVRGGLLMYSPEEIPGNDEPIPAETWIGLDVDIATDELTPIDLSEPLELSDLPMVTEVTFGGIMDAELLIDTTHLTSLVAGDPPVFAPNAPLNEPITTESWEASIDEPLHEDRMVDAELLLPFEAFVEVLVGYESSDGELTEFDQIRAFSCHDEELFGLMYVVETVDAAEATLVYLLGLSRGWNPIRLDDEGPYLLPPEQRDELYFAVSPDACAEPEGD